MTRKNTMAGLLAAVLLGGVVGTLSVLSAGDEADPPEEPRVTVHDGAEALGEDAVRRYTEQWLLAQRDREPQRERAVREREEALRRDMEEHLRRERERDRMERELRERMEDPDRRDHEPPFRPEQIEQFGRMMEMVEHMQHTCFRPEAAAMIALAGLKDDVPREPKDIADDLEQTLKRTRTLGLRNAIRLMLRDVYLHLDQPDRVLQHLHEMLAENDRVLQAEAGREHRGPKGEHEPKRAEDPEAPPEP